MRIRVSVFSFVLGALVAGVLVAAPVIRAEDKAAGGGNKIAAVSRTGALKEYKKQKDETAKLEAEFKKLQAPVDALSKDIEADKKKYEENKAKMSVEERKAFEDKVQAKYRDYQTELAKGQGAMDTMRQRSLEAIVKDYLQAVEQVGQAGGYDVVLESDQVDASPTVLYASKSVNITDQVAEYLNSHPSAAGAPKANAAEGGTAKKAKAAK
ncbi:MAG: OmpH family outer membrane protein [Candidatus Hydrogenedentes bacterium]|nr:OmpH family outer membrane protein [Candidatus Hydrogenedentota bacterium]